VVTAALVVATPPAAHAHTDLVAAQPDAASRAVDPVTTVRLEFATPVQAALTHVVVTGAGAVRVDEPRVDGAEVEVLVDGLTVAGEYRVAYRTVAADGHPVVGSYAFEVTPASASAARPSAQNEDGTAGDRPVPGISGATGLAVLVALLGLGTATVLGRARSRGRHG
jgi:methionine-rich copper-binding protein CopC